MIRLVASFIIAVQFTNHFFVINGVHRGQVDDRKHMLERFRSYFQKIC
jgi:hypothetical protein